MIERVAYLDFQEPFRIGVIGMPGYVGLEGTADYVPADVLFGGLCNAWARSFGRAHLEGLLGRFVNGEPPFLLSSGFPFKNGIRYLPCPLVVPAYPTESRGRDAFLEQQREDLKDARFVSEALFSRLWVRREPIEQEETWEQLFGEPSRALEKRCRAGLLPAIQVDRVTMEARIFHTGAIWVQAPPGERAGIYIRFRIQDQQVEEDLRRALEFLGEQGLGGDRNVGHGAFTVDWQQAPALEEYGGIDRVFCTLAPFSPGPEERRAIVWGGASYRLVARGGWVESPYSVLTVRKKTCRLLAEGSVFPLPPRGRLIDVTPPSFTEHRVYRYALAYPVGIHPGM